MTTEPSPMRGDDFETRAHLEATHAPQVRVTCNDGPGHGRKGEAVVAVFVRTSAADGSPVWSRLRTFRHESGERTCVATATLAQRLRELRTPELNIGDAEEADRERLADDLSNRYGDLVWGDEWEAGATQAGPVGEMFTRLPVARRSAAVHGELVESPERDGYRLACPICRFQLPVRRERLGPVLDGLAAAGVSVIRLRALALLISRPQGDRVTRTFA